MSCCGEAEIMDEHTLSSTEMNIDKDIIVGSISGNSKRKTTEEVDERC